MIYYKMGGLTSDANANSRITVAILVVMFLVVLSASFYCCIANTRIPSRTYNEHYVEGGSNEDPEQGDIANLNPIGKGLACETLDYHVKRSFMDCGLNIPDLNAHKLQTNQLCINDTCVSPSEFASMEDMAGGNHITKTIDEKVQEAKEWMKGKESRLSDDVSDMESQLNALRGHTMSKTDKEAFFEKVESFKRAVEVRMESLELKANATKDVHLPRAKTVAREHSADMAASGGRIVKKNGYVYHVFEKVGKTKMYVMKPGIRADMLLVGGGGGAGNVSGFRSAGSGGGGAGGLVFLRYVELPEGSLSVTIGDGAPRQTSNRNNGNNGKDSKFMSYVARGGGGGAWRNRSGGPANDGGSGGGSRRESSGITRGGRSTQDGKGGHGSEGGDGRGGGGTSQGGAGGGGATQKGGSNEGTVGGEGGQGFDVSSYFGKEFGDNGWFAGGGAGGSYTGTGKNGGRGGGGNGAARGGTGGDGMKNTGGGGGGAGSQGGVPGKGGSGILIVRYKENNRDGIAPGWSNQTSNSYSEEPFVIWSRYGQDLPGQPIHGTLGECKRECDDDSSCKGFSRMNSADDRDTSSCYLKNDVSRNRTSARGGWNTFVQQ